MKINFNIIMFLYCVFPAWDKANSNSYLRCNKTTLCQGTAKIVNDEIFNIHPHSEFCFPSERVEHIARFKQALADALSRHWYKLRSLYDSIAAVHPEASIYVPFRSIREFMKRCRRNHYPPRPDTLRQLVDRLSHPDQRRNLEYDTGRLSVRLVVDGNGDEHALFFDENFVNETMRGVTKLLIDATFRSRPQMRDAYQLLTIMGIKLNHGFPFVWVVMSKKTQSAYTAVLEEVKTFVLQRNQITLVMTDFEQGLRNAISGVFTTAQCTGCNTHYDRAIYQKAKALGLQNLLRTNAEAKTFFKKVLALAYLPTALIREQYQSLKNNLSSAMRRRMSHFTAYYTRYWLGIVTPGGFSVYGLGRRTNNIIESYHSRLAHRMESRPEPWDFVWKLRKLHTDVRADIRRLENNGQIGRHPRYSTVFKQKELVRAWRDLHMLVITVDEFMMRAAALKGNVNELIAQETNGRDGRSYELQVTPPITALEDDPDFESELFAEEPPHWLIDNAEAAPATPETDETNDSTGSSSDASIDEEALNEEGDIAQRTPGALTRQRQERTPERELERTPEREPERTPEREPERTPEREPERTPERTPEHTTPQRPRRLLAQRLDATPPRSQRRSPVPSPPRTPRHVDIGDIENEVRPVVFIDLTSEDRRSPSIIDIDDIRSIPEEPMDVDHLHQPPSFDDTAPGPSGVQRRRSISQARGYTSPTACEKRRKLNQRRKMLKHRAVLRRRAEALAALAPAALASAAPVARVAPAIPAAPAASAAPAPAARAAPAIPVAPAAPTAPVAPAAHAAPATPEPPAVPTARAAPAELAARAALARAASAARAGPTAPAAPAASAAPTTAAPAAEVAAPATVAAPAAPTTAVAAPAAPAAAVAAPAAPAAAVAAPAAPAAAVAAPAAPAAAVAAPAAPAAPAAAVAAPAAPAAAVAAPAALTAAELAAELESVRRQLQDTEERLTSRHETELCRICFTEPATHAFWPCGHCCSCEECADKLWNTYHQRSCPLCREACTSGPRRIYLLLGNNE